MKTKNSVFGGIAIGLLLGLSLTLVTNCKKKEKDPEPVPAPAPVVPPLSAKTKNLTGKNWIMISDVLEGVLVYMTGYGYVGGELFPKYKSCFKDNLIRFDTNFVITYNEGPTKCSPNNPQSHLETWAWKSNESMISMTRNYYNAVPLDYTVSILDSIQMKLVTHVEGRIFTTTYVKN